MLPPSPTSVKVSSWPLWADCPWTVPDGVEVRSDGQVAAFVNTLSGKMTGVKRDGFDPANLPVILQRIA